YLVLGIVLRREEQNGEVFACSTEPPRLCKAVHVRQHDVQDCEVGGVKVGGSQGFATVGCGNDLETCKPQGRGEKLADVGFVVDDKELGFGAVLFHDTHDAPSFCELSGCLMR